MKHNGDVQCGIGLEVVVKPVEGSRICILLQDGHLYGLFKSREDAVYWAVAQDLIAFSTYDLRVP
jgi:hypothetical protein